MNKLFSIVGACLVFTGLALEDKIGFNGPGIIFWGPGLFLMAIFK